jgi:hypothetical protein
MTTSDRYDGYTEYLNGLCITYGTERREMESNDELSKRLNSRLKRFQNCGSLFDLVHTAEQAIYRETPVGIDLPWSRRTVGLGLISKNRPGSFLSRLMFAFKAFWSAI